VRTLRTRTSVFDGGLNGCDGTAVSEHIAVTHITHHIFVSDVSDVSTSLTHGAIADAETVLQTRRPC
jgi:hypothetical protein